MAQSPLSSSQQQMINILERFGINTNLSLLNAVWIDEKPNFPASLNIDGPLNCSSTTATDYTISAKICGYIGSSFATTFVIMASSHRNLLARLMSIIKPLGYSGNFVLTN
jgi:hypothetical protein